MSVSNANQVFDVAPGTKRWLCRNFVAADGRACTVSVGVVRGARPGPVFANVAGQHGMEHVGPVILRDYFDEAEPAEIAGTLILVPSANPLALELDFEVYPERELAAGTLAAEGLSYAKLGAKDRADLGEYNMNRLWSDDIGEDAPAGAAEGMAKQIVRWLWRTAIAPADVVVDHHGVRFTLKPYVFAEEPVIEWTPFLGFEAIWCTGPMPEPPTAYPYRRLGVQSIRHGKVGMIIEYSVQHGMRESDRPIGRFAIRNVMKLLGMLGGEPEIRVPVWLLEGRYWDGLEELNAPHVGHLHFEVDEYQWLEKGRRIAQVRDLQTHAVLHEIRAPADGLMLHRTRHALNRPGEPACRFQSRARLLAAPGQPCLKPSLEEWRSRQR